MGSFFLPKHTTHRVYIKFSLCAKYAVGQYASICVASDVRAWLGCFWLDLNVISVVGFDCGENVCANEQCYFGWRW